MGFIRQEQVTDNRMKGPLYKMLASAVENQYRVEPWEERVRHETHLETLDMRD